MSKGSSTRTAESNAAGHPVRSDTTRASSGQPRSLLERCLSWYRAERSPSFDWIQVEVTSHCNAACLYCPRTAYRENWLNRHLPLGTYRKLLPNFAGTGLVYLQGWGEPLLHPDFFTMVELAKKAGCRVGTTTNGMLLDDGAVRDVVDSGMDIIAFSLAGTAGNDAIRKGTSLEKVLESVRRLKEIKEQKGAIGPAVHIAYMLLRSGIEDLVNLPHALNGLGVGQVVISTLDFVARRETEDEAFTDIDEAEQVELQRSLESVAANAGRCGIPLHYRVERASPMARTCTENIQRALVVSADGEVSPCVFTNIPARSVTFMLGGGQRPYRRLTFGSLDERTLTDIWRQADYARFRDSFSSGHFPPRCEGCPKLRAA